MFALRIIKKSNGMETNINLGDMYAFCRRKNEDLTTKSNEAFMSAYRETFGEDALPEPHPSVYGMLLSEREAGMPLTEDNWYYIVSGNGETFANLSKQ